MNQDRPWTDHYDVSVPASIDYPAQPLFRFLEDAAVDYPERSCILFHDQAISFLEMDRLTDRLAAAISALGIRKGDRVGILMPNIPEFVAAFYGILKAGAVVVAINPLYPIPEIARQANDSDVQLMFVTENQYGTLKEVLNSTRTCNVIVADTIHTLTSSTNQDPEQLELDQGTTHLVQFLDKYAPGQRPIVHINPDDIALFQYSGGTTGISKAAMASHRGVVANTIQFRTWLTGLEPGHEVMLIAIPLFHAYGMIAGMSLAMSIGASMALVSNARDMHELLVTINQHHPTIFPGVPSLYNAISNHPDVRAGILDLRSIRVCISGSTALLCDTKDRFEASSGGKICEGYGLSEAPVVTHCNPLCGTNKIGSIGMPMPDVECRVVDLEDPESEVEIGQSGELILRGPQVMMGYHNMPGETANVLRKLSDGKTWLFTGDIVRMDDDGYFYVVDRKKELIKPGGFQVWPREIEETIALNPKVTEVCVAGIPDPERGEAVKAWVVLVPGQQATGEEIRSWCKERLVPYKVPTYIDFQRELPKSTVGKILRRELVKLHKQTTPNGV